VRDAAGLRAAAAELDVLQALALHWPRALARIRVARALVNAAQLRSDSVGAHFRRDAAQRRSA